MTKQTQLCKISIEPITIILQMKALKTNQFNQLRQFMKKIDPQASLNLKTQNPSLQNLAQSSTFFLKSSSLKTPGFFNSKRLNQRQWIF